MTDGARTRDLQAFIVRRVPSNVVRMTVKITVSDCGISVGIESEPTSGFTRARSDTHIDGSQHWVHAFTLRDRKIVSYRGYEDSAAVVNAFTAKPTTA